MFKITKMLTVLLAVAAFALSAIPAAQAAPGDVIDSSGFTASSTDVYRSWEAPELAVNPTGTPWPGLGDNPPHLVGEHPNEEHEISHNSDGQFRNYADAGEPTPTTLWFKVDLGANYFLETLRVWNGGFFRLGDPNGNGNSGINQADMYYSSAVADPGDDFNVNWTLIGTAGTQTFNPVTGHDGATNGSFGVTDEIALNGIDAHWFALNANSNHGASIGTGIAEVQFIEGAGGTTSIYTWQGDAGAYRQGLEQASAQEANHNQSERVPR